MRTFLGITVVKGDATVAVISAASILAKVARDREILVLDSKFPSYDFARHNLKKDTHFV